MGIGPSCTAGALVYSPTGFRSLRSFHTSWFRVQKHKARRSPGIVRTVSAVRHPDAASPAGSALCIWKSRRRPSPRCRDRRNRHNSTFPIVFITGLNHGIHFFSSVISRGFSQRICFPALAVGIVTLPCITDGVAMVTASIIGFARNSSKLLYALQWNCSARFCAAAALVSKMPTSSVLSKVCILLAASNYGISEKK